MFFFKSKQEICVGSYTDNINVDPLTGMFCLVGILRVVDAALHSANHSHFSPSQVFEVNVVEASASGVAFPDYEVREVYTNDGKELVFTTTNMRQMEQPENDLLKENYYCFFFLFFFFLRSD